VYNIFLFRQNILFDKSNYFQVQIGRNYDVILWWEDIKQLVRKTGIYKTKTLFLCNATKFPNEIFFDYLSRLVSNYEIIELFNNEERAELLEVNAKTNKNNVIHFQLYNKWNSGFKCFTWKGSKTETSKTLINLMWMLSIFQLGDIRRDILLYWRKSTHYFVHFSGQQDLRFPQSLPLNLQMFFNHLVRIPCFFGYFLGCLLYILVYLLCVKLWNYANTG